MLSTRPPSPPPPPPPAAPAPASPSAVVAVERERHVQQLVQDRQGREGGVEGGGAGAEVSASTCGSDLRESPTQEGAVKRGFDMHNNISVLMYYIYKVADQF